MQNLMLTPTRNVSSNDYSVKMYCLTKFLITAAPVRTHFLQCERCHRSPTHFLLNQLAKKKLRKSQKDVDSDIEMFEGDEVSRIERLGGWVRW